MLGELFHEIKNAFETRGLRVPESLVFDQETYAKLVDYAHEYFRTNASYPCKRGFRILDMWIVKSVRKQRK